MRVSNWGPAARTLPVIAKAKTNTRQQKLSVRRTDSFCCRVLVFAFAITGNVRAAGPQFDTLIAFADRDQVRLSTRFQSGDAGGAPEFAGKITRAADGQVRSEEHTSELQ